jgi:hypothetical protein
MKVCGYSVRRGDQLSWFSKDFLIFSIVNSTAYDTEDISSRWIRTVGRLQARPTPTCRIFGPSANRSQRTGSDSRRQMNFSCVGSSCQLVGCKASGEVFLIMPVRKVGELEFGKQDACWAGLLMLVSGNLAVQLGVLRAWDVSEFQGESRWQM